MQVIKLNITFKETVTPINMYAGQLYLSKMYMPIPGTMCGSGAPSPGPTR